MSESCPKCGSPRTQFESQTSWECGSYQSLIGGSHIKTPAFKLIESDHCLCRTALAAATNRAEEAEQCNAQLADVLEFTQLQVAQLTTERDGCRDLIATLRTRIAEAEQENARLRELLNNKEEQ